MTTITQTITDLPTPPQTSDPDNFDSRADAFVTALDSMQGEINTWASQANTVAGEVNTNASNAADSETAAAASEAAADASANATAYNASNDYTVGVCAYSTSGSNAGVTYRCIQNNGPSHGGAQPLTNESYWTMISFSEPYMKKFFMLGR